MFCVLLLGSLFKLQRNPHKIVSGFFLRLLTSKLVNDIADICESLVSMNLFLLINFIDSEMHLKLHIHVCLREDGGWASTSKPAHVYHGVCGSQRTILGNMDSCLLLSVIQWQTCMQKPLPLTHFAGPKLQIFVIVANE